MVDPGPGQVRRPGDELPQRPGHRLPLRSRRAYRAAVAGAARQTTSNQHFFSELGQRIIKTASRLSAYGRLYEVDAAAAPHRQERRAGHLAWPSWPAISAEGGGQLWERQALCKARVVYGSPRAAEGGHGGRGAEAAFEHRWKPRRRRGRSARCGTAWKRRVAGGNLKRGPGGIVDIEFLVQMLQLKHGRRNLRIRSPNTLTALAALDAAGISRPTTIASSSRGITASCGPSRAACG